MQKCRHCHQCRGECCMTCIVSISSSVSASWGLCANWSIRNKRKRCVFTVTVAVCCTQAYLLYPHHLSQFPFTSISLLVVADMAACCLPELWGDCVERLLMKQKKWFWLAVDFQASQAFFLAWRSRPVDDGKDSHRSLQRHGCTSTQPCSHSQENICVT